MANPSMLAAPWLGHGRAVEMALAAILGMTGIILFAMPEGLWSSPITADLAWRGLGRLVPLPFLVAATLKGVGLWLNITGRARSSGFRFAGAFLASFIWGWYLVQFVLLGAPGAGGVSLNLTIAQAIAISTVLTGFVFSLRIMAMARANLPTPGAPGRL